MHIYIYVCVCVQKDIYTYLYITTTCIYIYITTIYTHICTYQHIKLAIFSQLVSVMGCPQV